MQVWYQAMQQSLKIVMPPLVLLGIGYGSVHLPHYLAKLDYFNVKTIEISGNNSLTKDEIIAAAGIAVGQNSISIDLADVRQCLLSQPYIESAAIERKLPGKINIVIKERQAAAFIRTPKGFYSVGADGLVLENIGTAKEDKRFKKDPNTVDPRPVFQGIANVQVGEKIIQGQRLLSFLAAEGVLPDFSHFDVTDDRNPVLFNRWEKIRILLGPGDWGQKLSRYFLIYQGLRARSAEVDNIDLRYARMVVVSYKT